MDKFCISVSNFKKSIFKSSREDPDVIESIQEGRPPLTRQNALRDVFAGMTPGQIKSIDDDVYHYLIL